MYDYVIYLGRFEPFHEGHYHTLQQALEQGKTVILGVGSSNRSRSTTEPFTFDERVNMIHMSLTHDERKRVLFEPINDYPYNDTAWIMHVHSTIKEGIIALWNAGVGRHYDEATVALIGFKKDESSKYLEWFPDWDFLPVDKSHGIMSATDVRDAYFRPGPMISEFLPTPVRMFLKAFATTDEYKWLVNEFEYIRKYHKDWGTGPFFTVDAVVEQMGHVLLVTRRDPPFKGKLAIPGGFVNLYEWIEDARQRELREETKLDDGMGKMPPGKMKSFLQKEKVYDDPRRSARGRIITFAGLYRLPAAKKLYKVVGSDDAEKAAWYNMSDLRADMFMEDHYFILQDMLGLTEGI